MNILIGSDPELFVFNGEHPISAHGMIEGSKYAPQVVEGGAVQVDGMALEYNTNPASTLEQWEDNHVLVQRQLEAMIEEGLTLKALPTAFFSEEVFNTTPKEALILGCEPDFNAYTGRENPQPDGDVLFRTGAGHVHIGWGEGFDVKDPFHMNECIALVKMLDLYLGVPSILSDMDIKRRTLYGRAGAFRPKSYGVEYRTLSNFWVQSKMGRRWVFNNTIAAIHAATIPNNNPPFYVPDTINTSNKDEATHLCHNKDLIVLGELNDIPL